MEKLTVRTGTQDTDSEWDHFLEQIPDGRFEQCSGWAAAKMEQGWRCSRIEILRSSRIIGGFQILFRNKGPIRIGYISKGPAIDAKSPDLLRILIKQIKDQAATNRITALLVHPTENGHSVYAALRENGFLPNKLYSVIEATLFLDTSGSQTDVLNRMSRKTRQKIRQSIKRGVKIREGRDSDLSTFFQLMQDTCKRQGNVAANPSSLESLNAIWKWLHPRYMRLTFAEVEGKPVSGLLCVLFGDRVTLWKKGWNSNHADLHPNELLYYETLEWARANGWKKCDFGAVDAGIAVSISRQSSLSEDQKRSRHFFNIAFGGYPAFFPGSCIWFRSLLIRRFYWLLHKALNC
jgi:lipid II:glycine glycyltransferase (peptidoglycan interpeptide bridge formation enzyme)